MSTFSEPIGVLGAGGAMGMPMTRRLLGAGISVRAWNRSAEKLEPLRDEGAEISATPRDAARGAGAVLTMLSDEDAVLDCMQGREGALAGMSGGSIWVQSSTIGQAGAQRCAQLAGAHGVPFLDAPVLGTVQPAEEGKLVVLASGPPALRERLRPVFGAMGHRTIAVGDQPGAGSALKMVVNSWVLTVVEGAAEMVALAEGLGVDPALLLDAVEGGTLDLPYLRIKASAMLQRDFEPSFRLALAAKDATLIEQAAQRCSLSLPLLVAVAERMRQGAQGHGEEDFSAVYLLSAPQPQPSSPEDA